MGRELIALLACLGPAFASPVVLRRGWNLGNTLDDSPPAGVARPLGTTQYMPAGSLELTPPVDEPWVFATVKQSGFDWVRIPVQWGPRTAMQPPYSIDPAFMAQVRQTVKMAVAANLTAMVNTHHEDWADNEAAFPAALPRLDAIWAQVAAEFAGYGRGDLVFELFNEPSNLTVGQLNTMNAKLLATVRKTNPDRQVHLGGLAKMGTWWILAHPDAMVFPASDKNLALTVHSYTPWDFAGPGPTRHGPTDHVFGPGDVVAANKTMSGLAAWSRVNGVPVVHDEFGCTFMQSNRTARLEYYGVYARAAEANGVGWAVWDDDGWYRVLSRRNRSAGWDDGILKELCP